MFLKIQGFATCGTLALCIGCFCYFIKLFKMYEEYLKFLFKRAVGLRNPAKEDDPALLSGVNFQLTLALLWVSTEYCKYLPWLVLNTNDDAGDVDAAKPTCAHVLGQECLCNAPSRPFTSSHCHTLRLTLRPLAE